MFYRRCILAKFFLLRASLFALCLDGRLFPSFSTEFPDRCSFVTVAAPDDNFPSLLPLSRVILIGMFDFFFPGGTLFLLAPTIYLLTIREAIEFGPRILYTSETTTSNKKL